MVKRSEAELDLIFHALADSTRRGILRTLADGKRTVGELANPYEMSLAAVSKHIKVLRHADLVKQTRDGRLQQCEFNPAPIKQAAETLAHLASFWDDRLSELADFLTTYTPPTGPDKE